LALLHQWRGGTPLLHEVAGFYRMQRHRHAGSVTRYPVTRPSRRGDCLSAPPRIPLAGTDRAHADWLRAWRLLASRINNLQILVSAIIGAPGSFSAAR
jgi:hypothetical protein